MAAGEVALLTGSLIQLAQLIRDLGRSWYKASADWADFPLKLNRLERKHKFWLDQFTKLGLRSDAHLMQTLREAQALLETEKIRLETRGTKTSSCGLGCCSKLSMTVFPDKVGFTIQRVIDAYDEMFNQLKQEEEASKLLENRRLRQHSPCLTFHEDDRYVPFKITEDAVNAALNNSSGLSVILLHGGPGKGKSTLARHLALNYKEKRDPTMFEQVVYLECGPKVNILAKQLEILQHLVSNSTSLIDEGQSGSDILIPKRLSRILKDQKILLVFDDVWEAEFLHRIVDLCGPGVKCLVTSQLGGLCDGMSRNQGFTTSIQIENIQVEDGRKILASHTGLSNQKITSDVEIIMNRMIIETEGNPLALASIATAIDYGRADDVDEWERASQDFLRLLRAEDTSAIHGKKYPKSFWSAMSLSIQSLENDVKDLLILIHLCEGPSVPEEVVGILYKTLALKGNRAPLAKSRKELESRELLKITTQYLSMLDDSRKERSWSVHSLHKLFIEDELGDRKKSMLDSLLARASEADLETQVKIRNVRESAVDDDAVVHTVLCALYLDRQFAEEAARKTPVPLERFDNLRRNAIQPITRLLGKPVSERWPASAQASVRQVLLAYICDDKLPPGGILKLLTFSISTEPMLSAMSEIFAIQTQYSNFKLQLLSDVARFSNIKPQLLYDVARFPGVVPHLAKLLLKDESPGAQEFALQLLGQLVRYNAKAKLELVRFPQACNQLVGFLSKKTHPLLQAKAALAIRNTVNYADDDIKRKLSTTEGLIDGLLGILADRTNRRANRDASVWAPGWAACALTLMDPTKGNGVKLHSWCSHWQRGRANMLLGLNTESLADLDKALEQKPGNRQSLWWRTTVRTRLGDFQGALADINSVIEVKRIAHSLQERGVLKQIMGDFPGALKDLNEGLALEPDDSDEDCEKLKRQKYVKYLMEDKDGSRSDAELALRFKSSYDYEMLKHRGHVKYLMKDEDGARSDAELALRFKPSIVDLPGWELNCLGAMSVAYLNYKL